jgi:hypothetical protein
MSNIPKARELLHDALATMPAPWHQQVAEALKLMCREAPAKRRAPVEKQPMDAFLAERIRAYVARHPAEQLQDVAGLFNVNIGRVSEALHRKR